MNAADFINNLATNAGLADSNEVKTLLADAKLATIQIPDTVANQIQSSHLTLESAKANPQLINHFREAHLSRADKTLLETLAELEADDTVISEIKGIKSTYDKIPAALKKIAELKSKQASAQAQGATGKAAEYEKQVVALNDQIAALNKNFLKEKQDLANQFEGEKKSWILNQMLLGYDYAGEQPKEVTAKLAAILLEDKLRVNGWQTKTENNGLSLLTNEGTKVFENNKELTLKALTDKIVSDNKLIKVTAPSTGATTPATSTAPFTAPAQGAQGNTAFDRHLAETLQNLQLQS